MPRLVKGPDGITHSFPDDATDDEVRSALGGDKPQGQRVGGDTFSEKIYNAAKALGTTALGAAKSAAHTALDLGETAGGLRNPFNPAGGTLSEAVDTLYNKPGLSTAAFPAAREATAYANPNTLTDAEHVGAGLETAAEMFLPGAKGASAVREAIPSTARAASKFQSVMGAARAIPIDITDPGNAALRIQQLAERGGTMPRAVTQFLRRVTDPEKPQMAYEEARDFASNISRLSADEFGRLTPAIQREVAGLRVALNKSVASAAEKAGKGKEYVDAMTEYAKAKHLQNAVENFTEGAKKALPYVGGAGAGYYLTKKLGGLLSGGE